MRRVAACAAGLAVRRGVAILATALLLPLLVVLPATTSQSAVGSLLAEGLSAPAGVLWLPGDLGGHLWVADAHRGFCRLDGGTLASATCQTGPPAPAVFRPGQPAYDAVNHLVYLPDRSDVTGGVLVLSFDPATETLSAPHPLHPDLASYAPTAVTLGPDGTLYVASSVRGRGVLRVVDRLTATPSLVEAARTLDGGPVAALAVAGGTLYLAEQTGVTEVENPQVCSGCVADKSEVKAASPQAMATDDAGRLFVSDTPLDRSFVLRVNLATGIQDVLASTGSPTLPFLLSRALTVHDGQVVVGDDPTGSGLPAGRGRIWTIGADDTPELAGTVDEEARATDISAERQSDLVVGELTAPAGAVRLGADLWVADHLHGFCRLDADGLGGFTLNQDTCTTAAISPGQPAYDEQSHFVYLPDPTPGGLGVIRVRYNQTTNTVVDRTALAPGQGLGAIGPTALALGPDGNLYVAGIGGNTVARITDPDGATQVLQPVARTQDPLSTVHALAFVQSDLYVAEDTGLTRVPNAIGCSGFCVAAATDLGVTHPTALVSNNADVLYAADTPNVLSMVREIDLTEREAKPFVATGLFPGGLISPYRLVSGLGLDAAGNLLVADDPSDGLPEGGGRLWQTADAESPQPIGAAPSTPSAPDLMAADDRGASPLDNVTNLATVRFAGASAPGTTVTLRVDGIDGTDASVEVGPGGSYQIPLTLTPGRHLVSAVAVNAFGRRGAVTADLTVTVDTSAPAAPSAPALAAASDSGRSAADAVTATTGPTVIGSAEPASSVRVLVDGADAGARQTSTTGQYSLALPSLGEGGHDVTATATDLAGNTSAVSPVRRIVVDTMAPAAPARPSLDPASDTGSSSSDAVTGVLFPTVVGSAEPGAAVAVQVDGATVAAAEAGPDGSWRATTAVNPGSHRITAAATDAAGNSGPLSAALPIVVDTDLPALVAPRAALAEGRSLRAGRVPLLVGWHAADPSGPVTGSRVELSRDRGASWSPAGRTGPGDEELLLRLAPSAGYQLRVDADDRAGNTAVLTGARQRLWLRGDGALRYGAGWHGTRDAAAQGHRVHRSSTPGATARTTVSGGELGWVTTTGPTRGRAAILVDGHRVATVDLWSRHTHHGVLAFTRHLAKGHHRVVVRVLAHGSLSRGNRVDLDAVVGLS